VDICRTENIYRFGYGSALKIQTAGIDCGFLDLALIENQL
jgi:hypothetical protein